MDFQGKVIEFLGETSGTNKVGKPWKKKEWVVETFGTYPRKIKVQCFGERADTINLQPGNDYSLFFDLESREYNGRWYTDVTIYRADPYVQQMGAPDNTPKFMSSQPEPIPNGPYTTQETSFTATVEESEEDLPF